MKSCLKTNLAYSYSFKKVLNKSPFNVKEYISKFIGDVSLDEYECVSGEIKAEQVVMRPRKKGRDVGCYTKQ